jgi:predicted alpha/beta superfamily hydrolase
MEEINQENSWSGGSAAGALQLHELKSNVFGNTRMLRVWVPPGYDAPENAGRHYPVMYLNDGQNLFDPATAFGGVDWQVDETAERLIGEGSIPPMIFVGIDHAGKDRAKEYLTYRALNPPVMRPRGKLYPEFLIREVMPLVGERYRIARGAENTGLGGSSLGAVISLFMVLDRPGIVGKLLLESPSLFVSNRRLLKYSHGFRQWPERIFMAMGTREAANEERDKQVVTDVRELERIVRRAGLGPDRLRVEIAEGAGHNEGEWARRFAGAMKFLWK